MHRLKNIFFVMTIYIGISLCQPPAFSKERSLPAECTTQCKAPYGEILGVGSGNVPAYSNCNAACVVFSPNKEEGTYTGIQWQCVEYARRWLLVNKGVVYGDVDIAADIWALDYVTRIKDKTELKMSTFPNGSEIRPETGDLLIYAKEYLKTGHVAVISNIDPKSHAVHVIEQNYNNTKWANGYARSIPYVEHDNKFWLLDSYLLGWKRVTNQPVKATHNP
ncbi:MAG: CHAP domain-containing protein [Gammaproteobacteria bacterium]|nr:CHAP domain-containing protein [Gammaproteobacteria bacterium]